MWIFLSILAIAAIIGLSVWSRTHSSKLDRLRVQAAKKNYTEDEINKLVEAEAFPIPGWVRTSLVVLSVVFMGLGTFNQVFFYAEPGYIYHVRTITGQERVIDSVGYNMHLFGRINAWKKAMTIQAATSGLGETDDGDLSNAEGDDSSTSASLPPLNIMFLDQVDADAFATARFRIPSDRKTFLEMAHEYRTPENLLRTALIPAFKETLQATGSLMSAEEYYSGGRTEFVTEFENQMNNGIYIVKREEMLVDDLTANMNASANASKGVTQDSYGDSKKVVFRVNKQLDPSTGLPLRNKQKFTNFGISVVDARITDMKPNSKFVERMQLKQKASADRAIAREQRIQEEEQKLLAEAKGEREVAERQAAAKVEQIEKTTNAETAKQLVLTKARQQMEQAAIDKKTSAIRLEQARIDAKKIKTLADAEAYRKKAIITADNALQQKLATEVEIQKVWAEAYAKRAVPSMVFGSGGASGAPVGSDGEASTFMKLMTIEAAKRLAYDREIGRAGSPERAGPRK